MTIGRIPSVEGGIQPTIVDAKGDLIAATAADTVNRLAVGSNDQVLVADSSTSTGLAWKSVATPFAAGKNKIINGAFDWNQRAFTSTTTNSVFMFDRFQSSFSGGTVTYTAQTFTPGTAPVAGYESKNFLDVATSGQSAASDFTRLLHKIESGRTFAGQTITFSFWAKAASGTPSVAVELTQNFGTGGSPSTAVNTGTTKQSITTSWARYSFTMTLPSVSGKTFGTANDDFLQVAIFTSAGSNFDARTNTLGTQAATISFWGLQIEAGSVATPFQTATGTLQGELAACQRYYERMVVSAITSGFGTGLNDSTTAALIKIPFKVSKRTAPTALEQSGTASDYALRITGGATVTASAVPTFLSSTTEEAVTTFTVASGLTSGQAVFGRAATTNAYLGWSAEL